MSTNLLARFAESTFWLARYMERAENLARFLHVNETFARTHHGVQEWLPIVQLHVDEERFFAVHEKASADAVIHFYVLDPGNPGSIVSMVRMGRENARALRHLISTEMWTQLNVFYNELAALRRRDVTMQKLSRVCAAVKEGCQAHFGITEGTLYRDHVWCFYALGKYIERADMTSRLLDVRYHQLLGPADGSDPVTDISQWNALLRFVAGYQAFRRTHPRVTDPDHVAEFLLFERHFPRSIAACVNQICQLLARLEEDYRLASWHGARRELVRLNVTLQDGSIEAIRGEGLHAFSDRFQNQLIALTDELGRVFFASGVEP